MTHKNSGLRTLSHGWGNVSQIETWYLCLFFFLFFFCLLPVIILSLLCLLIVVWDTIHECQCLRHIVLPAFTQTPPQTHISHFGMTTLPVLASLIVVLKLCCSPYYNPLPLLFFFSLFLYSTPPIPLPFLQMLLQLLCISSSSHTFPIHHTSLFPLSIP